VPIILIRIMKCYLLTLLYFVAKLFLTKASDT